jgi:predicted XRE-type DNA-binding protein
MEKHTTKGNVLDDLGFSKKEAENLKIRASLMLAIKEYIKTNHLTQTQAAKAFGVDQARINKLLRGRIELFTIDKLVNMLANVKLQVKLNIAA